MQLRRWWWLVAAVLAFALYAPTIGYATVIDDDSLLHADLSLRQILFDPGPPETVPYYRPITVSTYVALQAFGQGSAQIHAAHVSSLLLYAAAAATVYWLALALLRDARFAALGAGAAAVLFAVHPIHTESVAWITARPDIIAGLFIVAALFAYQRFRETRATAWLGATALAALAAPLSKEVGVSVFVLLPAYEWLHVSRLALDRPTAATQRTKSGRRSGAKSRGERRPARTPPDARVAAGLALAAAAVAYLALRLIVFHGLGSSGLDFDELRPSHVLGAAGFYAEKLFVPRDLVAYYAAVPTGGREIAIGVVASAAFAAALLVALRARCYAPAFGLVWIATTLLPSMPPFVAGPSNAPIAERYLYLPSIGMAVCVAWLVASAAAWLPRRWPQMPATVRTIPVPALIAVAPALIVGGVFAFATVGRLGAYADLETFWATAVRDNPSAGFSRAGLAAEYARQGRLEEAEQQFLIAANDGVFEDDTWRGLAWDSLATVYKQQGDYAAAVGAYEQGIALYPTSGKIHYNLALAHYQEATKTQPPDAALLAAALDEARLATEHESGNQTNFMFLARVAQDSGDFDTASDAYREVLRIDSGTEQAARASQELARLEAMSR